MEWRKIFTKSFPSDRLTGLLADTVYYYKKQRAHVTFLEALIYIVRMPFDNRKKFPFGLHMYEGLPGEGKTLMMTRELVKLKIKYPDCKIYTNYNFYYEDAPITCMEDILRFDQENKTPTIIALDETHLTFQNRQYKDFPPEILEAICQNRKHHRYILLTVQDYNLVDKNFRLLLNKVTEVRNYFRNNRFFLYRSYIGRDYARKYENPDKRVRSIGYGMFMRTEALRSPLGAIYDTEKTIEKLKKAKYDVATPQYENKINIMVDKK